MEGERGCELVEIASWLVYHFSSASSLIRKPRFSLRNFTRIKDPFASLPAKCDYGPKQCLGRCSETALWSFSGIFHWRWPAHTPPFSSISTIQLWAQADHLEHLGKRRVPKKSKWSVTHTLTAEKKTLPSCLSEIEVYLVSSHSCRVMGA